MVTCTSPVSRKRKNKGESLDELSCWMNGSRHISTKRAALLHPNISINAKMILDSKNLPQDESQSHTKTFSNAVGGLSEETNNYLDNKQGQGNDDSANDKMSAGDLLVLLHRQESDFSFGTTIAMMEDFQQDQQSNSNHHQEIIEDQHILFVPPKDIANVLGIDSQANNDLQAQEEANSDLQLAREMSAGYDDNTQSGNNHNMQWQLTTNDKHNDCDIEDSHLVALDGVSTDTGHGVKDKKTITGDEIVEVLPVHDNNKSKKSCYPQVPPVIIGPHSTDFDHSDDGNDDAIPPPVGIHAIVQVPLLTPIGILEQNHHLVSSPHEHVLLYCHAPAAVTAPVCHIPPMNFASSNSHDSSEQQHHGESGINKSNHIAISSSLDSFLSCASLTLCSDFASIEAQVDILAQNVQPREVLINLVKRRLHDIKNYTEFIISRIRSETDVKILHDVNTTKIDMVGV